MISLLYKSIFITGLEVVDGPDDLLYLRLGPMLSKISCIPLQAIGYSSKVACSPR